MKLTHWTLFAGVGAFALLLLAFKAGWLARGPALILGVCCWGILRWTGRSTAKAAQARRQRELEELKNKPVLRIDD